ncbi:molybdenum cofactor synthesis domain protein [Desulfurococcus amylolyticus 1221n]|uniref:Molybdenum cofactor synthesis domain protein n=1 Tax=Desulfurococcus amylolyticus (strain DSM 18924 / JCM 16383 / VKM B-2413 / 1221n) TaxID=490899 RepID=B8D2Y3_DESA1|nr:molybdenum cofactor synthesis domain protein [Desulfurococcus amylolyticus 1221n]
MVLNMTVKFHIVVVSDRVASGESIDVSGEKAIDYITAKGHMVTGKTVIGNNYRDIVRVIREANSKVVLFIGGTGPSPRDITVDVIESLAWRTLPGFGEAFRRISYEREGSRALLSRAGLYILPDGRIAVVLPGSPSALEIGLKILMDIIEHLVEEVERFEGPHR